MSCAIFLFFFFLTRHKKNDVGLCCVCFGGCLNKLRIGKKNHFLKEETILVTDNSKPRAGDYSKAQAIFQSNYGLRRDWCSDQWSKIISLTSPTKERMTRNEKFSTKQWYPYWLTWTMWHFHTSDCSGISFDTDDHEFPPCLTEPGLLWWNISDAPYISFLLRG